MCKGRAHAVASVPEALLMLDRYTYDVGLLDVRLGAIDGIAFLPRLIEASPKTRWVVLTIEPRDSDMVRAIGAGAAAYMSKHVIDRIDHIVEDLSLRRFGLQPDEEDLH